MGETIDRLAKGLASGSSRRTALASLLTGAAAALPWTAEAKKNKNKRKKKFKKYQAFCRQWCGEKFGFTGKEFNNCVDKAKEGKGACYSSSSQGPGYFCREVLKCGEECCPNLNGGAQVTDGECCVAGESCTFLNSTYFCTSPA